MKTVPDSNRTSQAPFTAFLQGVTLFFSCIFLLSGCYLLKQGGYIIRYNRKAVDIDRILAGEKIPKDTREFLLLVKEIKSYATREIGLKEDKNYTRFIDLDRHYLADVVSACRDDAFEPYAWRYPFFGSFPYKGFFEREDAAREARRLKDRGYDVLVRRVDAFSTLGFFNDSVYSFMRDYSVFEMASLIIHEQTHTTLYLRDQVQFNEELATFVGNEGALNFIRDYYGPDSPLYRESLARLEDFKSFKEVIREIYEELQAVYENSASREEKLHVKAAVIEEAKKRFEEQYHERFKSERFLAFKDARVNNAYILAYILYTQDLSLLYDLYEKEGFDLKKTVSALKALKNYGGNAKEYVSRVLLARN